MLTNEVWERRQNEEPRQRSLHVDAQGALGFGWPKSTLYLVEIGQKLDATSVVDIAVLRRPDGAGCALKQACPQVNFQLLNGSGHRGARKLQIPCGTREISTLHDPNKEPHGFEAIHGNQMRGSASHFNRGLLSWVEW